jgi:LmbE family N-acetylglucosaminyl deacetylase
VTFHAHPDDESMATAGVMRKAASEGHRVVLVTATRGEQGEPVPGVLAEGEPLWQRRVTETHRSAEILGVDRVEFLGYEDSGMIGEPTNDNPACFWQAAVDEAAERLAAILRDVDADVLTIYDDNGGYGHPDHIQVHRVGRRAAEMIGLARVYQSTMPRERMLEMTRTRSEELGGADAGQRQEMARQDEFGKPEVELTHAVDVSDFLDVKRKSMEAHESQISEESFFLRMPPDVFNEVFGTEWYIALDQPRPAGAPLLTDLFAGLGHGR